MKTTNTELLKRIKALEVEVEVLRRWDRVINSGMNTWTTTITNIPPELTGVEHFGSGFPSTPIELP